MKKIAVSLLFIFAMVIAAGAEGNKPLKIEGFDTPESVASDGTYFYVSNMGKVLNPTAKDNDGFISKLSKDGMIVERKFLPKKGNLNSPKGILAVNGVLYAADVDELAGFDLKKRKQVFKLSFKKEETKFLNALTKKDDNTLFLSSTDTNKIFEVNISGKPFYKLVIAGVKGANGLKYDADSKKLYVVGWGADNKPDGEVGVIDMSGTTPSYKTISPYKGFLDGIVLVDGGKKLIFSDWIKFEKAGVLKECDIASGKVSDVPLSEPVGGPADIYYDSAAELLWIPMMMEGKVLIEKRFAK
ncbi:MAG: hypothetical protein HY026_07220 [Deltaproteobacteria bacterium]|nr:hypothetical protein [Deltaproteobacteria bacterium]